MNNSKTNSTTMTKAQSLAYEIEQILQSKPAHVTVSKDLEYTEDRIARVAFASMPITGMVAKRA